MYKVLTGLLTLALALGLVGCGSDSEGNPAAGGAAGAGGTGGSSGALTFALTRVELNQSVPKPLFDKGQPVTSTVPALADRPGLLRIFYDAQGDVSQKLEITVAIGSQTVTQMRQAKAGNSLAADLTTTLNVDLLGVHLPAGEQPFSVDVKIAGSDATLARFPATGTTPLKLEKTGTMDLVLLLFQYDADGSGRTPNLDAAARMKIGAAQQALFPVAAVNVSVAGPIPWAQTVSATGQGWSGLMTEVQQARSAAAVPDNTFYLGLVQPAADHEAWCANGCIRSMASQPKNFDPGSQFGVGVYAPGADVNYSWVLGSAHGRMTAGCASGSADPAFPHKNGQIGGYGYDSVGQVLYPSTTSDFMTECATPHWVSDYTFTALYDRWRLILGS